MAGWPSPPCAPASIPASKCPRRSPCTECWDLVRTSEQTGIPCMMLENVCYFQRVLALLRMVREGVFGEVLHCEAGYQHDCRFLMFDAQGKLTWRGQPFRHHERQPLPHPCRSGRWRNG